MIVAVMMVRDEADVVGFTLAHLLAEGVDHVIVADNLSTDDTGRILRLYAEGNRVTVLEDDDPAYEQAAKMTRLAHMAYGMGATWVLPVDADEVPYCPDGRTLGQFFGRCDADVVKLVGYDHVVTPLDDQALANPFLRIAHRRIDRQKLPKVAFRANPAAKLEMGNHGVDHPGGCTVGGLELRHFQFRSLEQMTRKYRQGKAAYDATDPTSYVGLNYRRGHFGTHWLEGGSLSDEQLAARWNDLLHESGLICDPAPVRG